MMEKPKYELPKVRILSEEEVQPEGCFGGSISDPCCND